MEQVPLPVFSGTTALILFAVYLRIRNRVTTLQMLILMAFALLMGFVILRLLAPAMLTGEATPPLLQ